MKIKQHSVALFFLLTFILTWPCWMLLIPQVQAKTGLNLSLKFSMVGLMGPGLAAVFLSYLLNGRNGLYDLFSSLTRWRMEPTHYFLLYVCTFYFFAAAAYLSLLFGLSDAVESINPGILGFPAIFMLLKMTIIYTLCEEMGWRGFALPRLSSKIGALKASILIGVITSVWHLPLYFMGVGEAQLTIYSLVPMFAYSIAYSMIMSWFYFKANGSFLVTGLLHGFANSIMFLFPAIASNTGQGVNNLVVIMLISIALLTIPYLIKMNTK